MKLGTENYVIVLGCPALGTSPCLHRLLFRADKPPARQSLSIKREVHLTLSPCTYPGQTVLYPRAKEREWVRIYGSTGYISVFWNEIKFH